MSKIYAVVSRNERTGVIEAQCFFSNKEAAERIYEALKASMFPSIVPSVETYEVFESANQYLVGDEAF